MNFNVRAYGVILQQGKLLLSRELIKGKELLKFPGGGLEAGEGLAECLQREFSEENGMKIQVGRVLYVNPDHVPSMFHSDQQVISLYFEASILSGEDKIGVKTEDHSSSVSSWHLLEWHSISEIKPEDLFFPIDRKMISYLHDQYSSLR